MIRFAAVLSANPAPASANTRPRQKLRFGDLAREIARSVLTIVLFDNERGGRWEGGEVPISCRHRNHHHYHHFSRSQSFSVDIFHHFANDDHIALL